MAETSRTTAPGSYPLAGVTIALTALSGVAIVDTAKITGQEMLLLVNTTAGPLSATVTGVADKHGRTATVIQSIPASGAATAGPFLKLDGWQSTGGGIQFSGSIGISAASIVLPVE